MKRDIARAKIRRFVRSGRVYLLRPTLQGSDCAPAHNRAIIRGGMFVAPKNGLYHIRASVAWNTPTVAAPVRDIVAMAAMMAQRFEEREQQIRNN